jgi:hypothetical protein
MLSNPLSTAKAALATLKIADQNGGSARILRELPDHTL